jgi:phosphoribosylformylglycinamidine synthase
MSLTLKLPGPRALSEFRLNKLLSQAQQQLPALTAVRAQYWHFIWLRHPLSDMHTATLRQLLIYGPSL